MGNRMSCGGFRLRYRQRWLAALLALASGTTASPAAAQSAVPMMAQPAAAVFPIRGFNILGDNPLADGETTRILARYLRTDATIETLQQATVALEMALRDKGHGLYRVVLPPQEVGTTVTLNIVRFTVNKVEIDGRTRNDEANIRRALPALREGQTPNFKALAIQAAIANENPNKQVQVGIRESSEPDQIDATITVRESRPWNFGVSGSNAGSRASGQDRVTVSGSHTNVLNLDHQLVAAYTTSLERAADVRQLGLSYRAPLYSLGGVLDASYTRSDVVGDFGAFSSTGAGQTAGLRYTLYLTPVGGSRSYLTLGIDDKVFDASKINDTVVPGQLDRRSRPVSLVYTVRTQSALALWGAHVEVAANTGSGSGNNLDSYRTEDLRIATTRWKAVRGGISYAAPFAAVWNVGLRGQFQFSPDVLISGEQFGLGGLGSVRGTSFERPMSGDKAVSATVEVTTPEVAPGLRLLAFADAGWLGNNDPNGTTKPGSDRLGSVGLGLRYGNGPFTLAVDYGRLVQGSRVPLEFNSAAPQKGDDRIYINLSARF